MPWLLPVAFILPLSYSGEPGAPRLSYVTPSWYEPRMGSTPWQVETKQGHPIPRIRPVHLRETNPLRLTGTAVQSCRRPGYPPRARTSNSG
ncbi:protein of unknown function [Nitrospira defluvii]|uniref:Uncharacterized protein n=1 Tax=Nitrospira defluvii TaxID=330214 RepID=D8PDJ2_9BACT|nr:protein of unknown function [Nitrospira defluvii]